MGLFSSLKGFAIVFFTRIGKVIAHLIFWMGLLNVGIGILVGFGTDSLESNRAAASLLLRASTSGEAIDNALMYMGFALVLGVLCEISSRMNKPDNQA
jgi:hypothetical protein